MLHEFQVDSRRISFAGNDWLLGSISDDRIFIFEVTSGRLVFEKKLSVGQIWALSWIPGTRNLGIATEKSGVMFLDCFSGDLVGDFDCKQTPIMSMAVNATGSRLLAGARDTTILMWQMSSLKTKKQIAATISFEECESIYGSLGTDAAGEAYRKMCRLLASPKVSGTVLRRSLKPTPSVDEVAVGKLILALSNDKFTVRDNAKKELLRLGDGINPYLLLRLKNPIEEDERAAIKSIQEHFEKCSGAQLRDLRALMVLEMIADSESIESIGAVAKGTAAARLTIEAQAALKRLSKEKVIGPK